MPKAIYITSTDRVAVEIPIGTSLMRAAGENGVEGIIGDCGGNLSCATCHVFVEDEFVDRLPRPSETEAQMLDYTAAPRRSNSRLSCQLVMTEELDGLAVTVADPQL